MNKAVYAVWAIMWLAVCFGISVGIFVTGRLVPLWFFLIPAMVDIQHKEKVKG